MFLYFQSVVSDGLNILSVQSVTITGVLLAFIGYLIWQNTLLKRDITAKDEKITQIISEHTKDIKEGNKDMLQMVSKYHTFVEQLSNLTNHGRRGI